MLDDNPFRSEKLACFAICKETTNLSKTHQLIHRLVVSSRRNFIAQPEKTYKGQTLSLLCLAVSDEEKKMFYMTDTWPKVINLIHAVNFE